MQTIREVDFKGKTVLLRADFNVPLSDTGEILSDFRIRAVLPTLEFLREGGAEKIIVISHLGRPEGRDEKMSLRKVAEVLSEMVDKVSFCPEVSGSEVEKRVAEMKKGEILVLENLRFYPGEEGNAADFIKEIIRASGAEIYVQDGFAVLHRAHASTARVAEFLPVYAGLLLEKEVLELSRVLTEPKRPLVLVIGGSKVEDKAPLIERFLGLADKILVGGKIAADGFRADFSGDLAEVARGKIYVAEDFDEDAEGKKLDIGPVATAKFAESVQGAGTVVWNGLLGKAEDVAFATASTIMAEMMGEKEDATTVVCGGDTTGFVEEIMQEHPALSYSLISTGGGAALEFLLGKELPGLLAIKK